MFLPADITALTNLSNFNFKFQIWCFSVGCANKNKKCDFWAGKGYCKHSFVDYMKKNCMKSCNLCGGGGGGGAGGGGGGGSCEI